MFSERLLRNISREEADNAIANQYEEDFYDGQKVSISKIITSLGQSIVSMENFEIYALNHDLNKMEYILKLDGYSFYMMNILDYLIGNTNGHGGKLGIQTEKELWTRNGVDLCSLMMKKIILCA